MPAKKKSKGSIGPGSSSMYDILPGAFPHYALAASQILSMEERRQRHTYTSAGLRMTVGRVGLSAFLSPDEKIISVVGGDVVECDREDVIRWNTMYPPSPHSPSSASSFSSSDSEDGEGEEQPPPQQEMRIGGGGGSPYHTKWGGKVGGGEGKPHFSLPQPYLSSATGYPPHSGPLLLHPHPPPRSPLHNGNQDEDGFSSGVGGGGSGRSSRSPTSYFLSSPPPVSGTSSPSVGSPFSPAGGIFTRSGGGTRSGSLSGGAESGRKRFSYRKTEISSPMVARGGGEENRGSSTIPFPDHRRETKNPAAVMMIHSSSSSSGTVKWGAHACVGKEEEEEEEGGEEGEGGVPSHPTPVRTSISGGSVAPPPPPPTTPTATTVGTGSSCTLPPHPSFSHHYYTSPPPIGIPAAYRTAVPLMECFSLESNSWYVPEGERRRAAVCQGIIRWPTLAGVAVVWGRPSYRSHSPPPTAPGGGGGGMKSMTIRRNSASLLPRGVSGGGGGGGGGGSVGYSQPPQHSGAAPPKTPAATGSTSMMPSGNSSPRTGGGALTYGVSMQLTPRQQQQQKPQQDQLLQKKKKRGNEDGGNGIKSSFTTPTTAAAVIAADPHKRGGAPSAVAEGGGGGAGGGGGKKSSVHANVGGDEGKLVPLGGGGSDDALRRSYSALLPPLSSSRYVSTATSRPACSNHFHSVWEDGPSCILMIGGWDGMHRLCTIMEYNMSIPTDYASKCSYHRRQDKKKSLVRHYSYPIPPLPPMSTSSSSTSTNTTTMRMASLSGGVGGGSDYRGGGIVASSGSSGGVGGVPALEPLHKTPSRSLIPILPAASAGGLPTRGVAALGATTASPAGSCSTAVSAAAAAAAAAAAGGGRGRSGNRPHVSGGGGWAMGGENVFYTFQEILSTSIPQITEMPMLPPLTNPAAALVKGHWFIFGGNTSVQGSLDDVMLLENAHIRELAALQQPPPPLPGAAAVTGPFPSPGGMQERSMPTSFVHPTSLSTVPGGGGGKSVSPSVGGGSPGVVVGSGMSAAGTSTETGGSRMGSCAKSLGNEGGGGGGGGGLGRETWTSAFPSPAGMDPALEPSKHSSPGRTASIVSGKRGGRGGGSATPGHGGNGTGGGAAVPRGGAGMGGANGGGGGRKWECRFLSGSSACSQGGATGGGGVVGGAPSATAAAAGGISTSFTSSSVLSGAAGMKDPLLCPVNEKENSTFTGGGGNTGYVNHGGVDGGAGPALLSPTASGSRGMGGGGVGGGASGSPPPPPPGGGNHTGNGLLYPNSSSSLPLGSPASGGGHSASPVGPNPLLMMMMGTAGSSPPPLSAPAVPIMTSLPGPSPRSSHAVAVLQNRYLVYYGGRQCIVPASLDAGQGKNRSKSASPSGAGHSSARAPLPKGRGGAGGGKGGGKEKEGKGGGRRQQPHQRGAGGSSNRSGGTSVLDEDEEDLPTLQLYGDVAVFDTDLHCWVQVRVMAGETPSPRYGAAICAIPPLPPSPGSGTGGGGGGGGGMPGGNASTTPSGAAPSSSQVTISHELVLHGGYGEKDAILRDMWILQVVSLPLSEESQQSQHPSSHGDGKGAGGGGKKSKGSSKNAGSASGVRRGSHPSQSGLGAGHAAGGGGSASPLTLLSQNLVTMDQESGLPTMYFRWIQVFPELPYSRASRQSSRMATPKPDLPSVRLGRNNTSGGNEIAASGNGAGGGLSSSSNTGGGAGGAAAANLSGSPKSESGNGALTIDTTGNINTVCSTSTGAGGASPLGALSSFPPRAQHSLVATSKREIFIIGGVQPFTPLTTGLAVHSPTSPHSRRGSVGGGVGVGTAKAPAGAAAPPLSSSGPPPTLSSGGEDKQRAVTPDLNSTGQRSLSLSGKDGGEAGSLHPCVVVDRTSMVKVCLPALSEVVELPVARRIGATPPKKK